MISNGYKSICGIDEVGRGCIAGPVVAAAVVLPSEPIKEYSKLIRDSKTLSESMREKVYDHLINWVNYFGIGISTVNEIDGNGIVYATKKAMTRAVRSLDIDPDYLLIDAMKIENLSIKQQSIIKGDSKSYSIAAASILAKVTRDKLMRDDIHPKYPEFNLKDNKGYGTKNHIESIRIFGPTNIHRKTFQPIKGMIKKLR